MSSKLEFVIVLAFGKPIEQLHRENVSEFKRKPLSEICNGTDYNELMKVARLAPSAINSQPWYFNVSDNVIHAYCLKSNMIRAMIYEKVNKIDMGIAICHLWVAAKQCGKKAAFMVDKVAQSNPPAGYYYITSIKLND